MKPKNKILVNLVKTHFHTIEQNKKVCNLSSSVRKDTIQKKGNAETEKAWNK